MTPSPRVQRAMPFVALCLAHAAVSWPLWRGEVVTFRDAPWWVHPARALVRSALRDGHIPVWNAFEGLGFPIAADPLWAVFYPPNWLTLFGPLLWMSSLVYWLHGVAGGCGMILLARRSGARPWASAIAGIAWSLAGSTLTLWSLGVLLFASAWVPWCGLAGWDLAGRDRTPRDVAALGVAVALTLATGEVFVSMMAVAFALAAAGLRRAHDRDASTERPPLARTAADVALAGACAAMLSAPVWLPTMRLMAGTQRAVEMSAAEALHWSMHPLRLVDALMPGGLSLAFQPGRVPWLDQLFEGWPFLLSIYVGASACALVAASWGRGRVARWLHLWVLAALLLAFGRHTPVYPLLRWAVVPLRYMRTPEKFFLLAAPGFAWLAALGAERVLADEPGARRRAWIAPALLCLVAAFTAWMPDPVTRASLWESVAHAAAALVAVMASMRWLRARPAALGAALALVVAVDLGATARLFALWGAAASVSSPPPLGAWMRGRFGARRSPAPPRLYRASTLDVAAGRAGLASGEDGPWRSLYPKLNVFSGVAVLPGYDVAESPQLRALLDLRRVDLLRLFAVDAALMSDRGGSAPRGLTPGPLVMPGVRVYAVDDARPRVWLAGAVSAVDAASARSRLLDADVLSGRRALVPAGAASREGEAHGACELVAYGDGAMEARCHGDSPALAVFAEQHHPRWTAFVDGRPAPVVQADLVLIGVPVPAGEHTVRLRFDTPGRGAGFALWALGVLGCVGAWARRRPPRT